MANLYEDPDWSQKDLKETLNDVRRHVLKNKFFTCFAPDRLKFYLKELCQRKQEGHQISFTDLWGLIIETMFHEKVQERSAFLFRFAYLENISVGADCKSQCVWGWNGPLEVIWSNASAWAGSAIEQVAKDFVQSNSECLHRWRLQNTFGQCMPVSDHRYRKGGGSWLVGWFSDKCKIMCLDSVILCVCWLYYITLMSHLEHIGWQ